MMGKHRLTHQQNKVRSEKGDVIANRDAVNVLLVNFGYPALLGKKALESLIHRERKAKEKQGHSCQI